MWHVVVFLVACLAAVRSSAQSCERKELIRTRQDRLGVVSVALMGQMENHDTNRTDTVVWHSFLKVVRGAQGTTLFGYGWFEQSHDFNHDDFGVGPQMKQYLAKYPINTLYVSHMVNLTWQPPSTVRMRWHGGLQNHGIRLDAFINTTTATLFKIWFDGWDRKRVFTLQDCMPSPNLLTPWRGMPGSSSTLNHPWDRNSTSTGDHADRPWLPARRALKAQQPEPSQDVTVRRHLGEGVVPPRLSPMYVVVFLHHLVMSTENLIMQAQLVLRHAEYHLVQAGMQRFLIYVRDAIYAQDVWREYLANHMPAEIAPYITFVVWDEGFILEMPRLYYDGVMWDQRMVYWHSAVAMYEYPEAMATFIDLDEYVGWPGPAKTIHEALAQCDSDQVESIGLTSMYHLCGDCDYNKNQHAERDMWASAAVQQTDASCLWYDKNKDPLMHYNWTWDDTHFLKNNMTWATHKTSNDFWQVRGKQILRPSASQVWVHHQALMEPGRIQRWMDPDSCPFVVHTANVYVYRGNWSRGGMAWFEKHWKTKWSLVNKT